MNSFHIKIRSFARKTGLIRLINRLRPARSYEERVHQALVQAIKPGDVVWDIGANVGVYSELFCQWVGKDGLVVAFEPFPGSCDQIKQHIPDCPWLQIENIALGDSDTTGALVTGDNSTVNHLATGADANSAGTIAVTVRRGDTVLAELKRAPNVLKVDVEGFEEEVLSGMGNVLSSPSLRSALVEVHFSKLEERGRQTAPVRIEKMLIAKGFRTRWVDSSHIFATR